MATQKDTVRLLRKFFKPGHEGRYLDFKAKGITKNTAGKRKLVKHICAFANRDGGTILVGAGDRDGKYLLQSFNRDTEIIRDISNIVRDCTEPPLTPHYEANIVSIDIEDVKSGIDFADFNDIDGVNPKEGFRNILRIDVQPVERKLVKFDGKLYFRGEDGTRPMTDSDIDQHYQSIYEELFREAKESPQTTLSRIEKIEFEPTYDSNLTKDYQARNDRISTLCKEYCPVVPASGLWVDEYGQQILYSLSARSSIDTFSELHSRLEDAFEVFGNYSNTKFEYSFKYGELQWSSCSIENFFNDLENAKSRVKEMVTATTEIEEQPNLDTGRSLYAVAVHPIPGGVFWLHIEPSFRDHWESDFENLECEVLLPSIPFDDTEIREFFDALQSKPARYRQKTGLQRVKLNGNQTKLHNVKPLQFSDDTDTLLYLSADNPFYKAEDELQSSFSNPIPDYISKGLCSVEKLCFQISGGSKGIEHEEYFTVNYINILYSNLVEPVCFVDAHCWAHEKEDTDVYPDPIKSPFTKRD